MKGTTQKIRMLCFVRINSVILNRLYLWILIQLNQNAETVGIHTNEVTKFHVFIFSSPRKLIHDMYNDTYAHKQMEREEKNVSKNKHCMLPFKPYTPNPYLIQSLSNTETRHWTEHQNSDHGQNTGNWGNHLFVTTSLLPRGKTHGDSYDNLKQRYLHFITRWTMWSGVGGKSHQLQWEEEDRSETCCRVYPVSPPAFFPAQGLPQ